MQCQYWRREYERRGEEALGAVLKCVVGDELYPAARHGERSLGHGGVVGRFGSSRLGWMKGITGGEGGCGLCGDVGRSWEV